MVQFKERFYQVFDEAVYKKTSGSSIYRVQYQKKSEAEEIITFLKTWNDEGIVKSKRTKRDYKMHDLHIVSQ